MCAGGGGEERGRVWNGDVSGRPSSFLLLPLAHRERLPSGHSQRGRASQRIRSPAAAYFSSPGVTGLPARALPPHSRDGLCAGEWVRFNQGPEARGGFSAAIITSARRGTIFHPPPSLLLPPSPCLAPRSGTSNSSSSSSSSSWNKGKKRRRQQRRRLLLLQLRDPLPDKALPAAACPRRSFDPSLASRSIWDAERGTKWLRKPTRPQDPCCVAQDVAFMEILELMECVPSAIKNTFRDNKIVAESVQWEHRVVPIILPQILHLYREQILV